MNLLKPAEITILAAAHQGTALHRNGLTPQTITQKGLALPITQKCCSTAHDYTERLRPPFEASECSGKKVCGKQICFPELGPKGEKDYGKQICFPELGPKGEKDYAKQICFPELGPKGEKDYGKQICFPELGPKGEKAYGKQSVFRSWAQKGKRLGTKRQALLRPSVTPFRNQALGHFGTKHQPFWDQTSEPDSFWDQTLGPL